MAATYTHKIDISPLSVRQLIDTWLKVLLFIHSFIHSLTYNFFNTCTLSPWMSSSTYKFTLSTFRLARNLNVTKCLHSFIPLFISSYIKFASVPFRAREISLGRVQPLEIMKSDEIIIGTISRLTKAFIINLSCIHYQFHWATTVNLTRSIPARDGTRFKTQQTIKKQVLRPL